MVAIPLWLTGPGTLSCTVTPQTVNATTGVLGDTTPVQNLLGDLDEFRFSTRWDMEEIGPMDTTRQHMVPVKVGTQVTLTEILKKPGGNLLATLFYGSSFTGYAKFVFSRGITTTLETFTFYGFCSSYEETLPRGKSTGVMTIDMVDPGVANMALVVS